MSETADVEALLRAAWAGESSPKRAATAGWNTSARSRSIARTVRWKYTAWYISIRAARKPSSAPIPDSYSVRPRSDT